MASKLYKKFNEIEDQMRGYYYERDTTIRAVTVGLLANLNVIMVGPPGTAKTDISQAWSSHIKDARYFGTTLNPFTTPDEVFGAPDLKLYKETSVFKRHIDGYLPDSHIVAIEEIFKAGKGMLNSLIEVSHPNRLYSNGPDRVKTPVLFMIGTSNELPVGEDQLAAIYDRMIIKIYVQPIGDSNNYLKMISNKLPYGEPKTSISLDDIAKAREEVNNVTMDNGILKRLGVLRENLIKAGIRPSDRTGKLAIGALKAEAFLNGRTKITDEDLMFLRHMLWYDPSEETPVWSTIIEMIKPELKRLTEILEAVDKGATKALDSEVDGELLQVHRQIQGYIREAKDLRSKMAKKRRSTAECDDIITKLVRHASTISNKLTGQLDDEETEALFE